MNHKIIYVNMDKIKLGQVIFKIKLLEGVTGTTFNSGDDIIVVSLIKMNFDKLIQKIESLDSDIKFFSSEEGPTSVNLRFTYN